MRFWPLFVQRFPGPKIWLRRDFERTAERCRVVLHQGVRPMMELVLPDKADAVLNFNPDPELQACIEELAHKSNEGQLTDEEHRAYAGYVRANKFVAILKRQAKQLSSSRS